MTSPIIAYPAITHPEKTCLVFIPLNSYTAQGTTHRLVQDSAEKTKICFHYALAHGQCDFGDKCRYLHVKVAKSP